MLHRVCGQLQVVAKQQMPPRHPPGSTAPTRRWSPYQQSRGSLHEAQWLWRLLAGNALQGA